MLSLQFDYSTINMINIKYIQLYNSSMCVKISTCKNCQKISFLLSKSGTKKTVVGVYINTLNTAFLFKFGFLKSFFQITSSQLKTKRHCQLTTSLSFHVYVYPIHAIWKLVRNQNTKSKVVLILLIYTTTTNDKYIYLYVSYCWPNRWTILANIF